jgi:prepilin-type N-terminal cleavage/methylation domain-containing protein
MDRGVTLPEVVVVLVLVGILLSIAVPALTDGFDRAAVRGAGDRYAALHERARTLAVARGRLVRLEVDAARRQVTLAVRRADGAWDTLRTQALGRAAIAVTQPVVTFSPLGTGFGVSNTRLVFARGVRAETLTVSRTGRLRRW